jgi:hypothetical protein
MFTSKPVNGKLFAITKQLHSDIFELDLPFLRKEGTNKEEGPERLTRITWIKRIQNLCHGFDFLRV